MSALRRRNCNDIRRGTRLQSVVLVVMIMFSMLVISSPQVSAQDSTFDTQTVNKGYSVNPVNRNSADGNYNELQEGDQYTDTNFTASSRSITYGTEGGTFPTDLTSDDGNRLSYTETGIPGATTYQILRPDADGAVTTLVEYPTSPATDWDKVDETTAGGDGDTTYLEGVNNNQESQLRMSNMSDPGGAYNIDITLWHISRGETTSACTLKVGLLIGSTKYEGMSTTMTSTSYQNFSYTWQLDPSDSSEWTLADVNALYIYATATDANPDTRTTQMGIRVTITALTYQTDVTITYSNVTSTSQTIGYTVLCQGYRSASENFYVYAWNYTGSSWTLKTTIQATSDTNYNFNLASTERDSSGNEVKLRIVDASPTDGVQDIVYLDVLKVRRVEVGYAHEIILDATSVNQHGQCQLQIKGYTSSESFTVTIYNWVTLGYDSTSITLVSGTNTLYQFNLDESVHRLGAIVRIKIVDNIAASSDTTQDICYLDLAVVTWIHTNPTLTQDGGDASVIQGSTAHFWVIYTDEDNEAPSYVYLYINNVNNSMTKNNSGDTDYTDGCAYYINLDTTGWSEGNHTYYFKTKDVNSPEVTTSEKNIYIQVGVPPEITSEPIKDALEDHYYTYSPEADQQIDTWELNTNATWLTQDADGTIHGTPNNTHAHQWFTVQINATNENGTAHQNFQLNVTNIMPEFTSSPDLSVAELDTYYYDCSFDDETTGGTYTGLVTNYTKSYSWNNENGVLQFVAATYGSFWFNITISDNTGAENQTNYQNWTLVISMTLTFTSSPITEAFEDHPYLYEPSCNHEVNTWGLSTNATWLSQYTSNGTVYGTPTNQYAHKSYWVNITASATHDDAWQNYTLFVQNKQPTFTTTPPTTVWYTKTYSYNAEVDDQHPYGGTFDETIKTNYTGSYSYTRDTGVLSFTALKHGYFWFNMSFNDNTGAANATTYQNWTVTIATPYFTTTPITSAWEDHDYSYTPVVNTTVSTWGYTTNGAWVNQNPSTGQIYGTPTNTYSEQSYWVNISATTTNDGTVYQNYTIFVHNYQPQFTTTPTTGIGHRHTYYYNVSFDDWTVGGVITGLTTNFSGSYTWSTDDGKLSFVANTLGYFWFNITVTDNSGADNQTNYQNWTVTVWKIITFTSSPIMGAWEDHLYSYSVTTNRTIDSWYLDSNATWLSISGSGVVSGTPDNLNANEWYYVHVKATCTAGYEWQNYSVTVANYIPHITSTPASQVFYHYIFFYDPVCDDEGAQGGVYLAVTMNYSGTYSFWTNNGTLMFNASLLGQFWFNITFSDQSGAGNQTTYQNFTLTILSNAPVFTSTALTDAWEDHLYSYQATCNQTITTWGFSSNASWLSNENGHVIGIPDNTNSMKWYSVSISATNWRGTSWQNFTVTVANNITYFTTTPTLSVFFQHTYYYNASFEDWTTGGTFTGITTNFSRTYSWSNTTGKLQFFAAPVGYYWFNITCSDQSGASNQSIYQNFTVTIVYSVVFTSSPVTMAVQNNSYSYTATVNTTATWSFTTNSSWLSFNSMTHEVYGTPDNYNVNQWYWVNLTVTTPNGQNWQNYTLTALNKQPQFTSTPETIAYMTLEYYYNATFDDFSFGGSFTSLITNYTGTYTWDIETGKLNLTPTVLGFWYFNITIDDGTGATNATNYQNWTIQIKEFILIISTPPTTAWEDHTYQYRAVSSKNPATWGLITNATFLSIDTITGVVLGTPNNTHSEQSFYVNVTCVFMETNDYQNYSLYVYNNPPVWVNSPPTSLYVNAQFSWDANTSDELYGGIYAFISSDSNFNVFIDAKTGHMTFIATTIGTFYFNISYDDEAGAVNSTIYLKFIVTVKKSGPGGGVIPGIVAQFIFIVKEGTGYVVFKDTSTGNNIVKWHWDFGDGHTSSNQNPTHTYKEVGVYVVTLTITDIKGQTSNVMKQVEILETEPISLIPFEIGTILPFIIIALGLIGAISGRRQSGRIASIAIILAGVLILLMFYD